MNTHERAKRFREAREKLNQHGYQSMRIVDEQTGISKSTIAKLENEEDETKVNYIDIVRLAEHYGVSVAWLMEKSESYSLDESSQTVTRVTGLSPKAIEQIKSMKHNSALIDCLNTILESDSIRDIVTNILTAKTVNAHNKQPSEMADLIERLNRAGLLGGMTGSNTRMSNRELIDFYMYRAWKDTKDLYESIVKGENENGTR